MFNAQVLSRHDYAAIGNSEMNQLIQDGSNSIRDEDELCHNLAKHVESMELLLFRSSMKDFETIDKHIANIPELQAPYHSEPEIEMLPQKIDSSFG